MDTNPHEDALRSRWTLEGTIPLAGVAEGASWHRARTVGSGEDVALFVVRGSAALEAADAVRRAYLVEDPRLVPVREVVVLDDPREDEDAVTGDTVVRPAGAPAAPSAPAEPTTVVEYPLPTHPPLAALLAKGPLHPETARAVIGEAATGLEVARRRGLRHQLLDSNRVFVDTASGAVSVLGVGVEAAAHTDLDRSREIASFQDTRSLVALLFRALTGRSPRPAEDGTIPRPSTLAAEGAAPIPADLDLLCDLVLNGEGTDVPETTRELVAALEPWQSIPVTLEAYRRSPGGTADAPAAGAATAAGATAPVVVPGRTERSSRADAGTEPSTASIAPVPEGSQDADDASSSPTAATDDAPTDDTTPSEDTVPSAARRTGALAAGATGVAGAAAVGAAGSQAAAADPADAPVADGPIAGDPASGDPASGVPVSEDPVAADPENPAAPAASVPPEEEKALAAADPATSEQAKALVTDLHLDERRSSTAFPGHLDITAPAAATSAAGEAPPAAGASAGTAEPAHPAGVDDLPSADTDRTRSFPVAAAGAGTAAPAGDATTPPNSGVAPAPAEPAAAHPQAAEGTATTAPSPSVHHSASAAPGAPVPVGGRTESLAPLETGPIVVRGRDRAPRASEVPETTQPTSRSTLLREVVGVAVDADDPDSWGLGPAQPAARSRQSQWILLGAVLLVIIALVFAITSITSGLRQRVENPLNTQSQPTAAATTEPSEAATTTEPEEETTTPSLPAPEVTGAEEFSSGSLDHPEQVSRVTDGDTGTFWSTKIYSTPQFGGFKDGTGLKLTFQEKSSVTKVTVTTARNSGGTLELHALNDDGTMGDVIATGQFAGDGDVTLTPDKPVETSGVALWIPDLPQDSKETDRFRGRIAEVKVE